jgi:membrane dipeptidase
VRTSIRAILLVAAPALAAVAVVIVAAPQPPAQPSQDPHLALVRRVLAKVPLIDGHNDLPWELRDLTGNRLARIDLAAGTVGLEEPTQTDIPRLRAGGVGGQFWSVYVPPGRAEAVQALFEQIDVVQRMAASYPEAFAMAGTAAEVERAHRQGRIACLIGIEGGHSINDSLAVLRQAYAAGARYMTLTHSRNNRWADSATDTAVHGGLTAFGREVVREMNRLGMLVDLSHVSPETVAEALEVSEAPVIFSHSSARALCDHPRNVSDEVLRRMPANRGVVMATFVQAFISEEAREAQVPADAEWKRLSALYPDDPKRVRAEMRTWRAQHPAPRATLAQVANHIEHIRNVAGVDHVGIGSDFDGMAEGPLGLEDVSCYPALLAELARRGWTEDELGKLAGGNVLRAMRQAEAVAVRLQKQRPPSEALIEDLDGSATAPDHAGVSAP